MLRYVAVLALISAAAGADSAPSEEINLDLPPAERWVALAGKYREDIVSRCQNMGKLYQRALGDAVADRWVKAAPLDDELRAEFDGIVRAVNHPDVTRHCLVLTDMWQAVDAPSFGCTGLLAAMPNGTVVHGRNIDYDMLMMVRESVATGAGLGGSTLFDGVFTRGGKPVAEFLAFAGSLGVTTGMRFGAYSVNSNARLKNNRMMDNLRAHEAGGENFPWVIRKMLQTVPDFESAVSMIETTEVNAPNYFIFAGAGPYQGAVVTKDRLGTHHPWTPPTQRLDQAKGIWHLVQTNDDLLNPPDDRRRGAALVKLSSSQQSEVSMDFVQRQMQSPPVMNSDTLLTWVADPHAGTHRLVMKPPEAMAGGLLSKAAHRLLNIPMPQEFPRGPTQKGKAAFRGTLLTE
uniref:Acid ceramidase N-terminal domain-containing protein n=1 Tax=Alexandrium monilatum TaxID=311494 RepID=A0A7S4QH51_9DINO